MAGTAAGSKKAVEKILAKNPNHFKEAGRKGGLVKTPNSGFASMTKEDHLKASAKGGRKSNK